MLFTFCSAPGFIRELDFFQRARQAEKYFVRGSVLFVLYISPREQLGVVGRHARAVRRCSHRARSYIGITRLLKRRENGVK